MYMKPIVPETTVLVSDRSLFLARCVVGVMVLDDGSNWEGKHPFVNARQLQGSFVAGTVVMTVVMMMIMFGA